MTDKSQQTRITHEKTQVCDIVFFYMYCKFFFYNNSIASKSLRGWGVVLLSHYWTCPLKYEIHSILWFTWKCVIHDKTFMNLQILSCSVRLLFKLSYKPLTSLSISYSLMDFLIFQTLNKNLCKWPVMRAEIRTEFFKISFLYTYSLFLNEFILTFK